MEMQAAIEGLKLVPIGGVATILTDSKYVEKGITEWIHFWVNQGWKTSSKKPVKNSDLWKELHALNQDRNIKWKWVKGHAGNPGNERADELAGEGRDRVA